MNLLKCKVPKLRNIYPNNVFKYLIKFYSKFFPVYFCFYRIKLSLNCKLQLHYFQDYRSKTVIGKVQGINLLRKGFCQMETVY